VHLFSALDGRMLRVPLPPAAGDLIAALWDGANCNCAALVSGRPAPASAAALSVHTLVYAPVGLDGPGGPGRPPAEPAAPSAWHSACACLCVRAPGVPCKTLERIHWIAAT